MSHFDAALRAIRSTAEDGAPLLLLAPATDDGWFEGQGLLALGGHVAESVSIEQAAEALEDAFEGHTGVVAALLDYEGSATVVRFDDAEPVPRAVLTAALSGAGAGADARGAAHAATTDSAAPDPTLSREPVPADPLLSDVTSSLVGAQYRSAVEETRERIAAGDVYVLNLTRQLTGRALLEPWDAFATLLSRAEPSMGALLVTPTRAIASVSPERFLQVSATAEGRVVEVSPIKGTRPRGVDAASDAAFARELRADAKELAEHIMVVDLERNDLGRVCVPGSIGVAPLYEVVETPYCYQLVSTVRGTMREDASFAELLDSTFPCGSVTGAPKVAAMRIADELEPSPRGAYCGSLVVATLGRLDSSVLIRTLEYDADGSAAWGTGCGITIDSDPAAEWLESELKASPVMGDARSETGARPAEAAAADTAVTTTAARQTQAPGQPEAADTVAAPRQIASPQPAPGVDPGRPKLRGSRVRAAHALGRDALPRLAKGQLHVVHHPQEAPTL